MTLTPIPLPTVERIYTDDGSHIEPEAPDFGACTRTEALAWHAAVVAVDSGLPIRLFRDHRGEYAVSVGATGHSAIPYTNAWSLLNGIWTGVHEARKIAEANA